MFSCSHCTVIYIISLPRVVYCFWCEFNFIVFLSRPNNRRCDLFVIHPANPAHPTGPPSPSSSPLSPPPPTGTTFHRHRHLMQHFSYRRWSSRLRWLWRWPRPRPPPWSSQPRRQIRYSGSHVRWRRKKIIDHDCTICHNRAARPTTATLATNEPLRGPVLVPRPIGIHPSHCSQEPSSHHHDRYPRNVCYGCRSVRNAANDHPACHDYHAWPNSHYRHVLYVFYDWRSWHGLIRTVEAATQCWLMLIGECDDNQDKYHCNEGEKHATYCSDTWYFCRRL